MLLNKNVRFFKIYIYFCLFMSDIFKKVATYTFSLIINKIKLYEVDIYILYSLSNKSAGMELIL